MQFGNENQEPCRRLARSEWQHTKVPSRILMVEDDDRIRETTRFVLEDEGFAFEGVESGEEAMKVFLLRPPDCVLVDLMLPGMDGFETCRGLRQRSDVPIIMVTARADTFDVVAGLEAGADDYVTKPFEPKELTARIRALLRRTRARTRPPAAIVLGDLEIRLEEGLVRRGGHEITLTKTEFRLLSELASSPGRVFTREMLLELVWDYNYFGDSKLVDVHISRLRAKLEADPVSPRHVITVRGLGYKVVA